MNQSRLTLPAFGFAAAALLLTGCMGQLYTEQRHGYGSAMDFLYPATKDSPPVYKTPEIPATLRLPMRIGLAFAPDDNAWSAMPDPTKDTILDSIGKKLATYPFVQSVAVIPHMYLQRGGGFRNLRQIQTAFGVDVVGLVSYDQIANTSETPGSILYVTIIGRYFIPGDKHEVKTLVDLLLLDPQSETLLMRSAGASSLGGLSPDAFAADHATQLSREGYEKAVPLLLSEADVRLNELRDDIKSGRRKDVKVELRPGYTPEKMGGWGAGDPLMLAALLILAAAALPLAKRGSA